MHEENIKVCYISDLHFEDHTKTQVNAELKKLFENQVIELYKSDLFVIAGDISDDLNILKYTLHCFYKYVIKNKLSTKMIYVPGNHDLWDKTNNFKTIYAKLSTIKNFSQDDFDILYRQTVSYTFKNKPFLVAGLFGWYKINDKKDFNLNHKDSQNLIDRYDINLNKEYQKDLSFLNSLKNTDLIVSHVPLMEYERPIRDGYKGAFFTSILQRKISDHFINGHTHVDVTRIDDYGSVHVSNNVTKTSTSKEKALKLSLLVIPV